MRWSGSRRDLPWKRSALAPEAPGNVTAQERFAVGGFVAGLHGATAIAVCYAARLAESGASAALKEAVDAAISEARTNGPYGSDPPDARSAPRRGIRARAHARLSPARRRAGGAAGAAGRRLVHDRHRDALPDRRLPVLDRKSTCLN